MKNGYYDNEVFAKNLAKAIAQKGVSARYVAEKIGVAQSTMSDWMRAKKLPRMDKVQKLAEFFGCKYTDLIGETSATVLPTPDLLVARTVSGASVPEVPTDKMMHIMADNSMIFDCIPKDAKLNITPTQMPSEGDIILASVRGELLVRRYSKQSNTILLMTSNPKYKTIATNEAEINIYGRVTNVSFEM